MTTGCSRSVSGIIFIFPIFNNVYFFLFFCTSEFLCPISIDQVGMAKKMNIDGAVVKEMVEILW
jgi:hypothetical protein